MTIVPNNYVLIKFRESEIILNGIDYSKIDELPDGGDRLMRVFVRFEFALKECGYLKNIKAAESDWDKFSQTLGVSFFEAIKGDIPTLVNEPPKKQFNSQGGLGWKEAHPVENVQMLFGAVRRVRNNLLHGGKGGDPDHDRNETLIQAALFVLDTALQKHPDIKYPFQGIY